MKVLLTGATGFLGSNLLKRLNQLDFDVRILNRKDSDLSLIENQKFESVHGDITDKDAVLEASKDCKGVFHLAGVIAYDPRQRNLMEKVNVGGTQNVVDACRANKIQKLLYLSSVVAIGASFDKTPLNEDSTYNVSHLNLGYFETKHQAETIVKDAAIKGDFHASMINPSTIYGPGDALKGSRKTQLKVAQGQFKFFTSGGVNVVHVDDVLHCILKAYEDGENGERYIVGSENILIKDLFERIAKIANVEPPKTQLPNFVVHGIGHLGDFMNKIGLKGPITSENAWTSTLYHWFDSSKAQKAFSFTPKSANEALEESIRWSKENGLLNP
jgi:dihydroflavonol-4-reductase